MTAAIQLQDVRFSYQPGRPVLDRVSLTVDSGSFLAVVGPNGAGKSTLISLLAGQLEPQAGTITIDGTDIHACRRRDLARKVAVVRQEFVPTFGFSVTETVLMARTPYFSSMGFENQQDRDIVAEALAMTEITPFAMRPLSELSGGERQRVFIARALAQDTPILLLDEPTSFLDLKHQVGIYDLLKSIQQDKGRTIVAITHDINLAAQYCDQALLLHPDRPGRVGRPSEVFTPAQIEEAFGVPIFSVRVGRESVILPLGRLARDADRIPPRRAPQPPTTT